MSPAQRGFIILYMKILVVRFSSIGDIVLTTPILRCIKQQLPQATVHYLTKASFARVLQGNPYIDKLQVIEKEITEIMAELKAEKYDYILDLHNNLRTRRLKAALKVKSAAYPKLNGKKWLLVNLKINAMPNLHIVDRYFMPAKGCLILLMMARALIILFLRLIMCP